MKNTFPAYLRVLLIFLVFFFGIEYFIDSGDKPVYMVYPIVFLVYAVFLFVLIALEMMRNAADNITYYLMNEQEREAYDLAQEQPITEKAWYKKTMRFLTKSEPMETEEDVMLNHDYDGIRELDNKLPPWWVYLFYATIVFSVIYLGRYHMFGGPDQEQELAIELEEARLAIEEYKRTAPDVIDENTVEALTESADLAKGKSTFEMYCAACHRTDGGGQTGPNLTDNYWILGGDIVAIYKTIYHGGRDGKGMVAWKSNLKPTEILQVASYVLTLQGSNPVDPKAPEGDLIEPTGTNSTPAEAPADEPAAAEVAVVTE